MKNVFALIAAFIAGASVAETASVGNVTVRQRWPWSQKIDICFDVGEGEKVDVELSATWDGHPEPLALTAANGLTGRSYGLSGERGNVVWDPLAAGCTNAMTGFRVSASAVPSADRKWLVVNLEDGEVQFFADAPEGGWSTDVYKETKMVFRRVEGRRCRLGYTSEQRQACSAAGGPSTYHLNFWKSHWVTLSDDYYLAIYRVTERQSKVIKGEGSVTSDHDWRVGYGFARADYRGKVSGGIHWPDTRYAVASDSIFGKLRAKTGNRFVFDLPTEAQWENAARNGATTLWDAGGDAATITPEEFGNYVARFVNYDNKQVGRMEPNTLGFYDLYGCALELCLDIWRDSITNEEKDPVGPGYTEESGKRFVAHGMKHASDKPGWAVPAQRIGYAGGETSDYKSSSYGDYVVRPCIHLNSLFD